MKVDYPNFAGNSGVVKYEVTGPTEIIIEFVHGKDRYVYNGISPGAAHVSRMIRLAQAGRGLSTYISRNVGENFARKIPL